MAGTRNRRRDIVMTRLFVSHLRGLILTVTVAVLTATASTFCPSADADPTGCGQTIDGSAGNGALIGSGNQDCPDTHGPGPGIPQGPRTQVLDCGAPLPLGHILVGGSDDCDLAHNFCAGKPLVSPTGQPYTTQAVRTQLTDGTWSAANIECSIAAGPPAIDAAAVQAQFVKLLPTAPIKAAPNTGRAIANIEVLYWLDTKPDLDFGATALLGHQIDITAHIQSVTWNFGDGTTAKTDTPGRPYLPTDLCATRTCPDWFGHTYTKLGTLPVTATITWSGRYNVDGGTLLPITNTVTTAPTTFTIQVLEARAILVPNPTSGK